MFIQSCKRVRTKEPELKNMGSEREREEENQTSEQENNRARLGREEPCRL